MDLVTTRFTLTDQHIKLLRAAYVGWNRAEWGAPEIDPKRPYGNSSVVIDMCEILDVTIVDPDEGPDDETRGRMAALHRETELALQVVLATGAFEPGDYVRKQYSAGGWRRANKTSTAQWQPLTPDLLAQIENGDHGRTFWLAVQGYKQAVVGNYEWQQGHNPHGFNDVDGGGRVGAGMVTHVMPYNSPALPNA